MQDINDGDGTFAVPAPRPPFGRGTEALETHPPDTHYDPQYDMTGASYEALFLDGGLLSSLTNDEGDLGDVDARWGAYDDDIDESHGLARAVANAGQPARLLPLSEAVDALLATCPRMVSCKPATLALERAPLVHVIRSHMRTDGPVDFAPTSGGLLCASLAEACDHVEGLGPVNMLERGVVAWLAGRLMERVRPGSSQGVPVGPMSRVGAFVQVEFGAGWTFSHPDQLDARLEEPQHEQLRLLLAWLVDSARTVARVRDGVTTPSDAVPHRPPNGKDYAFGPLRLLTANREAYRTFSAHDPSMWATFLGQGKTTKRSEGQQTPSRGRVSAGRGRRSLARSLPNPAAPNLPREARIGTQAPQLLGSVTPTPAMSSPLIGAAARTGMGSLGSSLSSPSPAAHPVASLALPGMAPPIVLSPPPPPPTLPAATATTTATGAPQVIMPSALDATALDRAVLAQVQSIALMTLSATDPATLASGAHVAFMAPSITCSGAMAFTCWVALPPGTDDMGGALAPPPPLAPDANDERPRKRSRISKQPRRTKASAAKDSTGALCAVAPGTNDPQGKPHELARSPEALPLPSTTACTTTTTSVPSTTICTNLQVTDGVAVALPSQAHISSTKVTTHNPETQPPRAVPEANDGGGEHSANENGAACDTTGNGICGMADNADGMQLDTVHPVAKDTPGVPTHESKPGDMDFERLFHEAGPDEWDELLADGKLSCG
nr:hypothetical protein [Pandoravirus massiliensis]